MTGDLTLFDLLTPVAPVARRTDPDTSHLAAASVPRSTAAKEAVRDCLALYGPLADERLVHLYGQTRRMHGWPAQSPSGIRTRRAELVADGIVVDTGDVTRLESGRLGRLWAVKGRSDG